VERQALGIINKAGTVRETFVASMLSVVGQVCAPKEGDFLIDRIYLFEVGGKGKRMLAILRESAAW